MGALGWGSGGGRQALPSRAVRSAVSPAHGKVHGQDPVPHVGGKPGGRSALALCLSSVISAFIRSARALEDRPEGEGFGSGARDTVLGPKIFSDFKELRIQERKQI